MTTDAQDTRDVLVAHAQTSYSAYSHLMHRWDAWVLARMTRRVWRFGRLYVEKDEIVLADPEPTIESLRKIYSNRVNVELYVAIADVELIT